jgi:hypothetical protein
MVIKFRVERKGICATNYSKYKKTLEKRIPSTERNKWVKQYGTRIVCSKKYFTIHPSFSQWNIRYLKKIFKIYLHGLFPESEALYGSQNSGSVIWQREPIRGGSPTLQFRNYSTLFKYSYRTPYAVLRTWSFSPLCLSCPQDASAFGRRIWTFDPGGEQ